MDHGHTHSGHVNPADGGGQSHANRPAESGSSTETLLVPTGAIACDGCRAIVEERLRRHPDVLSVHVDATRQSAHVEVRRGRVTAEELAELVAGAYGDRSVTPLPKAEVSSHAHAHTARPAAGPREGTRLGRARHPPAQGRSAADRGEATPLGMDHAAMGHGAAGPAAPADAAGKAHHGHDMSDPRMAAAMEADMRRRFWISLILGIPVVLYSPLAVNIFGLRLPTPLGIPHDWVMLIFSTPVALWTSSVFHIGAYYSLRSRVLNMSVLVSLGVLVSYLFSVGLTFFAPSQETFYEAAVMLAVFLLFGHWMEMKARRGSSDAVRRLLDLTPPQATVERDGRQQDVPVAEVNVGDTVVLKPGDKVPVDGLVIDGRSALDESLVTGESLPVEKGPGDELIAGTINQSGSLRFRATKVGSDTALAQIVKLVEAAQNSKAPSQRLADRAAHYLVLIAVSSGLVTFLVWFLFAREPVLLALTFAVTAVVIACPDALGLATPTAVMVATDLAAKRGILFKQAVSLEQASKIQAIIFDKTGTLTEGRPRVTDSTSTNGFSPAEVLRLVGAAEARSGHPLAQAVIEEMVRRDLANDLVVEEFENLAGRGVRARVDGRAVLVGTRRLLEEQGVAIDTVEEEVTRLLGEGKTLMLVAVDGRAAGIVAAADTVRPSAVEAVARLRQLGIETVMMTGDNRRTGEVVARQVGIERVFAEVLPQDKADGVKRLQGEGKFVAMVGDGVNDAPALAQADLGLAIGAGTDVAVETGDIVLMKSDPADVLSAIELSKATVRKMRQNLFWAAIYNVIAIPIAAGALYPAFGLMLRPEFGALAMSASSITVVSNALLLRREIH
ncbi:MAG TPA: heavy metal translocating P-type ATPase [Dehalococcoidia bacterium]|nr:heavy metal translocating P-type ATPase [Dehalococcoidia bacterium]